MVQTLRTWRTTSPLHLLVAVFVIIGCGFTLFGRVAPIDFPGYYNNSVWFIVQSKLVAWIFVGEGIRRMTQRWSRPMAMGATVLVVLLAIPGSLNFFEKAPVVSQNNKMRSSRYALEVADHLAREAPEGAIVLTAASAALPAA